MYRVDSIGPQYGDPGDEQERASERTVNCRQTNLTGLNANRYFGFTFGRLGLPKDVHGHVDDLKTEFSASAVPMDPHFVKRLLDYKARCTTSEEGWLFANPASGRPYHQEQIQKTRLRRTALAAGIPFDIGWHTFRHSFRSWLAQAGTRYRCKRN
jgi:hypothetical protein